MKALFAFLYLLGLCLFVITMLIVNSPLRLILPVSITCQNEEFLLIELTKLSRLLNEKAKEAAQAQCQLNSVSSTSGGWCNRSVNQDHFVDKRLALALADFFQGNTVASFGEGNGNYGALIRSTGLIPRYDAYDGAPYTEELTQGGVKYLDLSLPQHGLPIYDWILSLEVGEHIPQSGEENFLQNLARHAYLGFIISWATPGQIGVGHVNPRPAQYIADKLKTLCFELDRPATNKLRRYAELPWLRRNLKVFKRIPNCRSNSDVFFSGI